MLRDQIKAGQLKSSADLRAGLKAAIVTLLGASAAAGRPSELALSGAPAVVLVVGVNGAGKTTTIGKLAHKFCGEGAKARGRRCRRRRCRCMG